MVNHRRGYPTMTPRVTMTTRVGCARPGKEHTETEMVMSRVQWLHSAFNNKIKGLNRTPKQDTALYAKTKGQTKTDYTVNKR